MSRLTDLLQKVSKLDPSLGAELTNEYQDVINSRNYGLVFEKHQPEAVELPSASPSRGATVRILPPRGNKEVTKADNRLWTVTAVTSELGERTTRKYTLIERGVPEDKREVRYEVPGDDLIVVSEFQDTIYPGLVETGSVECAKEPYKPAHVVLNAENYHALQLLTYTHRHAIDVIYIDPPYNSGAKDWKYNNDYVGTDDAYRHSKWLSFMERRLKMAKQLLNPDESVLIVTIDEKEYLRLGLLLEQIFPGTVQQMVTITHNPGGAIRVEGLNRVNEYAFYVFIGEAKPGKTTRDLLALPANSEPQNDSKPKRSPIWRGLLRGGSGPLRQDSPQKFYPVLVDEDGRVVGHGPALPLDVDRNTYVPPSGLYAHWPLKRGDVEGRWEVKASTFEERRQQGYVRAGNKRKDGSRTIYYLRNAEIERLENGEILSYGMSPLGFLELDYNEERERATLPKTVWNARQHNATEYGANLVKLFLPGRQFPYPKSLYAVEDALSFILADKREATILDFFAGSGTTAHAVMRLNKQDGGNRKSISVTNNEVSAQEQIKLRKKGLRPGDPEWEQWGICSYITKPRITAAIKGNTPEGEPIKGDYKFTDEFPMSNGFPENARFYTLTYLSPNVVTAGRAFSAIAPILWLAAGQQGRVIDGLGDKGWDVSDYYGVVEDMDNLREFIDAVNATPQCRAVFIVTDDDGAFELAAQAVRDDMKTYRLYESYLSNFEIVNR